MSRCPICKKLLPAQSAEKSGALADAKPYYPFCSDRCKLIDLGRWLDGAYQIPVAGPEEEDDNSDPAEDRPSK